MVHPLAVGRLAELGHQLVQGEVEGRRLVLRRGLGADHRALGPYGDLDPAGLVVLALVALRRELDLDPDDPVVELLQPGDLLRHVSAELLGHVAVAGLDDNIHAYLTQPTEVGTQGWPPRRTDNGAAAPTVPHSSRAKSGPERHRADASPCTHRWLRRPANPHRLLTYAAFPARSRGGGDRGRPEDGARRLGGSTRAASVRLLPVVTRSSTSTTGRSGGRPRRRNPPARLACRARASRPDWSRTPGIWTRAGRDRHPVVRPEPAGRRPRQGGGGVEAALAAPPGGPKAPGPG